MIGALPTARKSRARDDERRDGHPAAQLEFAAAGLVTEMKGASIPMGPDVVNFSVREPVSVVARIVPFNHPCMFAAGKSAAPLAAGNAVIVKPPDQAPLSALRLTRAVGRPAAARAFSTWLPGDRATGAALAEHRDGCTIFAIIGFMRRCRRSRGDARREQDREAAPAGARRQECADRLSGCRSRRSGRRRHRRNELRLVRPIVRLDQPRIRPSGDLRQGSRAREGADRRIYWRRGILPGRRRRWARSSTPRRWSACSGRALSTPPGRDWRPRVAMWRRAARRSRARRRLVRRAHGVRRRHARHAHRAGGDLRAGARDPALVRRVAHAGGGERRRLRPYLLDLDAGSVDRPSYRDSGGRPVTSGSTRWASISSARRSAASSARASGARNVWRSCCASRRRRTFM